MRGGVVLLIVLLTIPFAFADASVSPSDPRTTAGDAPTITGTPRGPILIQGDAAFTAANGVVAGRGTQRDPYVIEQWEIDATFAVGIHISDTTAFFIVRDVIVRNGGEGYGGILLVRVSNARVEAVSLLGNNNGLEVDYSSLVILNAIFVDQSRGDGIVLFQSTDVTITGPIVEDSEGGIRIEASSPVSLVGGALRRNAGGGLSAGGSQNLLVEGLAVDSNGQGIYLSSVTNATVTSNLVQANRGVGLAAVDSSQILFRDNRVLQNGAPSVSIQRTGGAVLTGGEIVAAWWTGVHAELATNLRIEGTRISGAPGEGILVASSSDVLIRSTNVSGNVLGIRLYEVLRATLEANTFSANGLIVEGSLREHHLHAVSADNLVDGKPILFVRDCKGTDVDGAVVGQLFLVNCFDVRVANLTVGPTDVGVHLAFVEGASMEGVSVAGVGTYGVHLQNVSRMSVSGLDVAGPGSSGTGIGLWALHSSDLTLAASRFTNLLVGASFWGSTNVTVADSRFLRNGGGLQVSSGQIFMVFGSRFEDNGEGIHLEFSQDGIVRDNEIVRTSDPRGSIGLWLFGVASTVLLRNSVSGHGDGAILFDATGILAYGNRFVGNWVNARDNRGPENRWDNGYPDGGNLWSDYRGWDDCGGPAQDVCPGSDRLGDIPYAIDDDSADRYPIVEVNPPNLLPVARIGPAPSTAYLGELLFFDATGSDDPDGEITAYAWDFGDGETAMGFMVAHAYRSEDTFTVTLTVTDNRRAAASATTTVTVTRYPEISLQVYEHAAGFRVPLPTDWPRSVDKPAGDDVTEVEVRGTLNGTLVLILVDMIGDASVRETHAYLDAFLDQLLAELRQQQPGVRLEGTPTYGTVSGHAATNFDLRYESSPVAQRATVVVSDPHDRLWLVLTTMSVTEIGTGSRLHDRIVAGFEITLPAPPSILASGGSLVLIGAVLGAALLGAVVALLVLRRRRAAVGASRAALPAPLPSVVRCHACGTQAPASAAACPTCGTPLVRPPEG